MINNFVKNTRAEGELFSVVMIFFCVIFLAIIFSPPNQVGTAKENQELLDKVVLLQQQGYTLLKEHMTKIVPVYQYINYTEWLQQEEKVNLHPKEISYSLDGELGPKLWFTDLSGTACYWRAD